MFNAAGEEFPVPAEAESVPRNEADVEIVGDVVAGDLVAVGVEPVLALIVLTVDVVIAENGSVAEESPDALTVLSLSETSTAASGTICVPPSTPSYLEVLPALVPVAVVGAVPKLFRS